MRKHLLLFRSLFLGSTITSSIVACHHEEKDSHSNNEDTLTTTDKTSDTETKNDEAVTTTEKTEKDEIIILEAINLSWTKDLDGKKLNQDSIQKVTDMIRANIKDKLKQIDQQITSENYELINLKESLQNTDLFLDDPKEFLFTIKIKDNNSSNVIEKKGSVTITVKNDFVFNF